MNIAPFSIPGLFPTKSPISECRVFSKPDGSLALDFFTSAVSFLDFSSSISTPNKKVVLLDVEGVSIFQRPDGDEYIYSFVLDGENNALPVGTYRLDILGDTGMITYHITNVDNPFNKGLYTAYHCSDKASTIFVLRDSASVDEGETSMYVEFEKPFATIPDVVAVKVLKDDVQQDIPAYASSITTDGFTVSFFSPIPDDGVYTIEWVLWTTSSPMRTCCKNTDLVTPYEYTVSMALPSHKRGDRWLGISAIGPVLINGEVPTAALERIRMYFRHSTGVLFKLDSDVGEDPDAPIVIDDSVTWEAHIPEVEEFLPLSGDWVWDMEFYEVDKISPLTLYKGTINVTSDVTTP